jgi:indolepyruvate ferredoxin oxidoreductase alpha subunit
MGGEAPAVNIPNLVKALGVKNIRVIDPYNLEETKTAVQESMSEEGPSVIITNRPCMLFPTKQKPLGTFEIDLDECNGCGACLRIGCPAISGAGVFTGKNKLEKAKIDPVTCTGCEICVQVCPIDVIHPLEKAVV